MLLLPLPISPAYNVLTEIEGVEYELVYTYDEHRDLWRLGVNRGDVVVMGHRPLLPFVQMRPNAFASALDGVFALIAPLPTDDAYEALTGGLWSIVYGLPSEIAELTDSLADLAGDADIPVVPIDVLYPPNNAILSNPVVTFSGTGPANQLLFARGESIQVDSMGGWSWTHTFSESNPVVVFEGESGQRATVRFSIIMQPLTINPVGEDIDGTRCVFTEDVEVTGTATPNSTITVNGQSVSVDSEGNWSIELTLQAGQSHVITAQGSDGQIAQTSVYVWGGPDLMALGPNVWLDPSDMATLFVDSEGTTPVLFSGDPVGLWKNKGTLGSNGDASQPVSANRPVWTDADGRAVLFDGGGSRLGTTYSPALPSAVFMAADRYGPPPTGGNTRIISTRIAIPYVQISDISTGTTAYWSMGGELYGHASTTGNRSVKAIGAEWSMSRFRVYAGQAYGGGPTPPPSNFTAAGPWSLNVNGNVQYKCGHVLIFDRILTDLERQKLLQWLEAQHD